MCRDLETVFLVEPYSASAYVFKVLKSIKHLKKNLQKDTDKLAKNCKKDAFLAS